jgi:glutamate-1-semialdehyde 2,1-aminomutase
MLQHRIRPNTDLTAAAAGARRGMSRPIRSARRLSGRPIDAGGNTRTVLHYSPFPLTITGGEGCRLRDLDGHGYADFLGEYTAGLYGHSNPAIQAAIRKVVDDGMALGGPNPYEAELAAEMCKRFPSVERVRFCNSGTEGNLFAFSTARLVTGRPAIMVFHGAYHGGVFYFGQHKTEINAPFPGSTPPTTTSRHAGADRSMRELAAVAIEPMMAAPAPFQRRENSCRRCAMHARSRIVLIFDEVMTSRLSSGGLQKLTGVTPDMTSFGKYLGAAPASAPRRAGGSDGALRPRPRRRRLPRRHLQQQCHLDGRRPHGTARALHAGSGGPPERRR